MRLLPPFGVASVPLFAGLTFWFRSLTISGLPTLPAIWFQTWPRLGLM